MTHPPRSYSFICVETRGISFCSWLRTPLDCWQVQSMRRVLFKLPRTGQCKARHETERLRLACSRKRGGGHELSDDAWTTFLKIQMPTRKTLGPSAAGKKEFDSYVAQPCFASLQILRGASGFCALVPGVVGILTIFPSNCRIAVFLEVRLCVRASGWHRGSASPYTKASRISVARTKLGW